MEKLKLEYFDLVINVDFMYLLIFFFMFSMEIFFPLVWKVDRTFAQYEHPSHTKPKLY